MQKTKNKLFSILMLSLILPVVIFFSGCGEKYAHIHFDAEEGQTVVYTSIAEFAGNYHIYVFDKGVSVPKYNDYTDSAYYHKACTNKAFILIHFTYNYGKHTVEGKEGIDCLASGEYYMEVEVKIGSSSYDIDKSVYLNGKKLTPNAQGVSDKEGYLEFFYDKFGLVVGETNIIEYKV